LAEEAIKRRLRKAKERASDILNQVGYRTALLNSNVFDVELFDVSKIWITHDIL